MEREKGFEPAVERGFSGIYATLKSASQGLSRPPDVSVHVSTKTGGGYTETAQAELPILTAELFLEAGFIVAGRALDADPALDVDGVLRRVCQLVALLRR